jgi:hypothetical protein
VDGEGKFVWRNGEAAFNFGKHRTLTLREVVAREPSYVEWLMKAERTTHGARMGATYHDLFAKGKCPGLNAIPGAIALRRMPRRSTAHQPRASVLGAWPAHPRVDGSARKGCASRKACSIGSAQALRSNCEPG